MDVIPFGPWAHDGVVEQDGVALSVVGLAEAHRTADLVTFAPGLEQRVPTLAAMVALKIIAWTDRRSSTNKDAGDVARLLRASRSGPYEDALWSDDVALAACGFDPVAAGLWRVGRLIAETFDQPARDVVIDALSGDRVELLIADARGGFAEATTELTALRDGLRSID